MREAEILYSKNTYSQTIDNYSLLIDNCYKMFGHPEGRVLVSESGDFEYQYAYSDHLGNTRMVYTSKEETTDYLATMEDEFDTEESEYFANLDTRVTMPAANSTPGGNEAARLSQNNPVGPSIALRVYPGDMIDVSVTAYYENTSGFGTTSAAMANMITAIAGSFGGVYQAAGESGLIFDAIDDAIGGTGGLGLGGNNGDDEPASYLNYLLFDENMVYLTGGFEVVPTSANMSQQTVVLNSVIVNKPGYVYMYVSYENLSDNHVHFDDLLVSHTKSPVVQVANYYPFGLQTSDSYTRLDTEKNQYLFNAGSKLNEHTGNYEMFFREYDPVLGRMTALDPMAGKYRSQTPYNYAFNTPVRLNDPSGADPFNWNFDMTTEQFVQSTDWLSGDPMARAQRYEDSYAVNHVIDWGSMRTGKTMEQHDREAAERREKEQNAKDMANQINNALGSDLKFINLQYNQGRLVGAFGSNSDGLALTAGIDYNFRHDSWENTWLYQSVTSNEGGPMTASLSSSSSLTENGDPSSVHGMAFTGDISKLYFDINFDTKDATVVTSDKSLGAVVIKYNYGYEKSSINLYSKQDIAAQGSPLVNSDHFTSNDGFYGIPRGFARSRINDAFGKSADAVWNTFIRGKGALYTDNWPWASNVEYRFTTNIGFNSTEYKLVIDVLYKD